MAKDNSPASFTLDIKKFVDKAKEAPNQVVRKACTDVLTRIVMRTPVGNPDTWEINKTAVAYNAAVADWNATLRDNPDNLDSRGRLKRGRKLNDGMDVIVPDGYVGGRLRANWFVSVGVPNRATTSKIDRDGIETINRGSATIMSSDATKGVYMNNSLPYAIPVEYGHSSQAPHGMVRLTVNEWSGIVINAARDVENEPAGD